jgi:hypothetical protein
LRILTCRRSRRPNPLAAPAASPCFNQFLAQGTSERKHRILVVEDEAMISKRGIPVIFATGYGADGLLDRFSDCPTLQKPFSQQDFAEAVAAACREQIAGNCRS